MKIALPPRIGWIIYECPNLIWFLIYLKEFSINLNTLPIILFITHYINRVIIYPFRYNILLIFLIRLSKLARPIPIEVILSAALYTTCNGYL